MDRILVEVSDKRWTMQAMHLACAMARNTRSELILLHLLSVSNPMLLGSSVGFNPPGYEERKAIKEYLMVAEDYGVNIAVHVMQYESQIDAIVQAAGELDTSIVFAHLPESRLSLVRKLKLWSLKHHLSAQGRRLYTLAEPQELGYQVAAVSLKVAK